MKQLKTHKMSFKQPQNKVLLNLKPTQRSKRGKTRWNTTQQKKKKGHLQKQSNLTNLGDEVGMRVSTLDIAQEAA
jgi:hypothetical protein